MSCGTPMNQVIDEEIWEIVSSDLAPLKAAVITMIDEFDQTDTA